MSLIYELKPEARERLQELANYLKANKWSSVLIEWNCDERGPVEYNPALGEKPATSAMKYMLSLGVNK